MDILNELRNSTFSKYKEYVDMALRVEILEYVTSSVPQMPFDEALEKSKYPDIMLDLLRQGGDIIAYNNVEDIITRWAGICKDERLRLDKNNPNEKN